jgi:hypothetical protein
MPIESIEHPFYDIDIEPLEPGLQLIKVLAIDGRRFTYQLHGELDEAAVAYIKSVLDAACFSDMLIEQNGGDFQITESTKRLKRHS